MYTTKRNAQIQQQQGNRTPSDVSEYEERRQLLEDALKENDIVTVKS